MSDFQPSDHGAIEGLGVISDPRRVKLPGPRIHPTHMKGWEAFGTDRDEAPLVRPLGVWEWNGGRLDKWKPGTTPWGAGEVRRGVSTIEIITSADSSGAFIYVDGTTEKGVTDAWHKARSHFNLYLKAALWD